MPRWAEAAGDELPAVDPDTGQLLSEEPVAGPTRARPRPRPPRSPRARRLRRATAGLAALSLLWTTLAVLAAGAVADLRYVERSWLEAASVDEERLAVDRRIVAAVERYGEPSRLAVVPLRQIAEEEALHLRRLERALAGRGIADPAVSRVRDRLAADLADLRAALAERLREPGEERLPAQDDLARLLRRWRLEPRRHDGTPRLALARHAVGLAERFAERPMATTLVALAAPGGGPPTELVSVDVDARRVRTRRLGGPADSVLVGADVAVVNAGGTVTAYPLDPSRPARWSVPGTAVAVPLPGTGGPAVWLRSPTGVVALGPDGSPLGPPAALGPEWSVGGAGRWLVRHAPPAGPVELWDPAADRVVHRFTDAGRLVAAADGAVAWQPPGGRALHVARLGAPVAPDDGPVVTERQFNLPPTDAGQGMFSPDGGYLAVPMGPSAGVISTMVVLNVASGQLRAPRPPAADVDEASPSWSASPEGLWLVWLSRDGHVAAYSVADRRSQLLRVPVPALRAVAAMGGGGLIGE